MEGCLRRELSAFALLPSARVRALLCSESKGLELTRSILNLIHNIVNIQSLEPTKRQKKVFEAHIEVIAQLLHKRLSLRKKKALLEANIELAIAAAASCRRAANPKD